MKIIKFEHSGLVVDNNGALVVCDPVEIAEALPAFNNVKAVIVTHKHSDHFQPEVLAKICADNPEAKIFTTEENVANIPGATAVVDGDIVNIDGFDLRFFGANHAAILPGVIPCQNIGVVINGMVANPGDSFDLPPEKVDFLCVPISAPWCKVPESLEYLKSVQPKYAIAFHDAILSEFGSTISNNWLKSTSAELGVDYRVLKPGESMEL